MSRCVRAAKKDKEIKGGIGTTMQGRPQQDDSDLSGYIMQTVAAVIDDSTVQAAPHNAL